MPVLLEYKNVLWKWSKARLWSRTKIKETLLNVQPRVESNHYLPNNNRGTLERDMIPM